MPDALAATYACSGLTAYGAIKKLGKLNPADEVVIIGAGGVGMMAIQIARALGIDPIVVDIDPAKLEAAQQLGVTRTTTHQIWILRKQFVRRTAGFMPRLILSVQNPVSITLATLRKGGMLLVVGLFGGALSLPIPFLPMNAWVIQGSYVGSPEDMAELMMMVREGKIVLSTFRSVRSPRPCCPGRLKTGKVKGRQVLIVD